MTRWLDSLCQDVRYTLHTLGKAPGFTVVTLSSLALGIGANTALFSLLNSVMLKSLPVREPERLVVIDDGSWTNPIWEQVRDHQRAFDGALAWGSASFDLAAGGGSASSLAASSRAGATSRCWAFPRSSDGRSRSRTIGADAGRRDHPRY